MSAKSRRKHASSFLRQVREGAQLRYRLVNALCWVFPEASGGYVRAHAYRWIGFAIGRGSFFARNLNLVGGTGHFSERLHVGENVWIGGNVTIDLDASVTIQDNVVISPFARIYTGSHDIGDPRRRCDPEVLTSAVIIEEGCWIALGATILPGVTVGAGSVVSCGSGVKRDVSPNSFVAPVPVSVTALREHRRADGADARTDNEGDSGSSLDRFVATGGTTTGDISGE